MVAHGYEQMDRLVTKALDLAGAQATVVLCTALSQTANREADRFREGFFRPRDLDAFAAELGLIGVTDAAPVMAEQAHLFFGDDDAARAGAQVLEGVRSGGEQVFAVTQNGHDVFFGCTFFTPRPLDGPLDRLLYWSEAPREGTHHPDGILWIQSDRQAHDVRVPLTTVAPTLLALMGVHVPPSMHEAPLAA